MRILYAAFAIYKFLGSNNIIKVFHQLLLQFMNCSDHLFFVMVPQVDSILYSDFFSDNLNLMD